MNLLKYLGLLLALGLLLVACQTPEPTGQEPLFTDSDLNNAVLEVSETITPITPTPAIQQPTGRKADPSEARGAQAVLPEAKGVIVYLRHEPAAARPWAITLFDAEKEETLLLYRGERELQSVAIDSIDTVVFTARETTDPGSDFEVFRVGFKTGGITGAAQLTDTPEDERNVSISADSKVIAWEGVTETGQRAVLWRDVVAESTYQLVADNDNVEPSLSADGERFALVAELASGEVQIALFELATETLTEVFSSPALKDHPSPAVNGDRVAWIEERVEQDVARVKTLSSGQIQDVVTSATGIKHLYMAESGRWLAYSLLEYGTWQLTVRDLQKNRVAAGPSLAGDDYAAYWRLSYKCNISPDPAPQVIRTTGSLTCDPSG